MVRELIRRHIGVRAEGMILASGIWMLVGVGIVLGFSPEQPGAWHTLIPFPMRIGLWCGTALLGILTAPSERWSSWGLALMILPPMIRVASHLTAWVFDLQPGPPPGDPAGWYSACYYLAMVMLIILLSHIPADVRAPLTGRRR